MRRVLVFLVAGIVFAGAHASAAKPELIGELNGAVLPGAAFPGFVADGRVVIQAGPGENGTQIGISIPGLPGRQTRISGPGVQGGRATDRPATDLIVDPAVFRTGTLNRSLNYVSPVYIEQTDMLTNNRPSDLNGLGLFFSSATGGVGFRMGFDRRLSPVLRFTAGPEFLTYGFEQSASRLGSAMPPNVTRITLVSVPVGLQRQFAAGGRVIPHVGFGVGPVIRFDHRGGLPGYYPGYGYGYGGGGIGVSRGVGAGYDGLGVGLGLPLDDFPKLSLTAGGFASSGMSIRLGGDKDYALTVEGRYTLAHFIDSLGNPGDFSGFSLGIGFGKYF